MLSVLNSCCYLTDPYQLRLSFCDYIWWDFCYGIFDFLVQSILSSILVEEERRISKYRLPSLTSLTRVTTMAPLIFHGAAAIMCSPCFRRTHASEAYLEQPDRVSGHHSERTSSLLSSFRRSYQIRKVSRSLVRSSCVICRYQKRVCKIALHNLFLSEDGKRRDQIYFTF